jgi:hypothetical protein
MCELSSNKVGLFAAILYHFIGFYRCLLVQGVAQTKTVETSQTSVK